MSKLITPAGFYTWKTQTIKNVAAYFKDNFAYNLELAQKQDKQKSRKEIPSIHGIGFETADVYGLRSGYLFLSFV